MLDNEKFLFAIIVVCVCFILFAPNNKDFSVRVQEVLNPWKFVAVVVGGLAIWFYISLDTEPEQQEYFDVPQWHRGLFDGS